MDAMAPPVTITPLDSVSRRSLSSMVSSQPSTFRLMMDLMDLAFMPCDRSFVGVSIFNSFSAFAFRRQEILQLHCVLDSVHCGPHWHMLQGHPVIAFDGFQDNDCVRQGIKKISRRRRFVGHVHKSPLRSQSPHRCHAFWAALQGLDYLFTRQPSTGPLRLTI